MILNSASFQDWGEQACLPSQLSLMLKFSMLNHIPHTRHTHAHIFLLLCSTVFESVEFLDHQLIASKWLHKQLRQLLIVKKSRAVTVIKLWSLVIQWVENSTKWKAPILISISVCSKSALGSEAVKILVGQFLVVIFLDHVILHNPYYQAVWYFSVCIYVHYALAYWYNGN